MKGCEWLRTRCLFSDGDDGGDRGSRGSELPGRFKRPLMRETDTRMMKSAEAKQERQAAKARGAGGTHGQAGGSGGRRWLWLLGGSQTSQRCRCLFWFREKEVVREHMGMWDCQTPQGVQLGHGWVWVQVTEAEWIVEELWGW